MSEIKEIIEIIKNNIKPNEDTDAYEQHFMILNNLKLIPINEYAEMVLNKKVNTSEANAYIIYDFVRDKFSKFKAFYLYPFLWNVGEVFYAYLSKLGVYYNVEDYDLDGNLYIKYYSAPAPSLKYVISYFEVFDVDKYSTIEIVDLDTAIFKIDLNFLLSHVDDINDRETIRSLFFDAMTMKLFSHYNAGDASGKLRHYFQGDISLEKEVTDIINDYKKIFRPIKICMKNGDYIDCSSIAKI